MLRDRRAQLHRQAFGELAEQRAEPLAAERVDVALERAGEIHRRDLRRDSCRSRTARARTRPPAASRRDPSAAPACRNVGLAARGILDRAVRAHDRGEIILHLAFARVAPRDAQLLPRRRRIDVEPGARGASFATGLMSGMCSQCAPRSYGTPKVRGLGDAAPADAVARLEQREAPARRRDLARRRNSRRARADDRHVGLARGRDRAERRRGGKRRRARDESASID